MSQTNSKRQIDVGRQQVAQVYARALLEAAEAASQAEAIVEQFDSLVEDVLESHSGLETLLTSALIAEEEKTGILERIFAAQASPLLLNFLKVLSRRGRLDCLRAIQWELRQLYDELRGRLTVKVLTAVPIDSQVQRMITEGVQKETGLEARLEMTTDATLVGGIVLRIGDTVFDGSVATQLTRSREEMIRRSIHEIQSGRDRFSHSEGN